MKKYYTDEAWAKRIAIRTQTSPQTLEAYRQKWKQLFLEVEAGLDLDPASEAAQLLARRWVLLAEAMSEGDSGIKAGAIDAWKDHRNWPLAEQEALFARYGLESSSDRNACMMRVEKVASFIGKAIGRKYAGSLAPIRFTQAETSSDEGGAKRLRLWLSNQMWRVLPYTPWKNMMIEVPLRIGNSISLKDYKHSGECHRFSTKEDLPVSAESHRPHR